MSGASLFISQKEQWNHENFWCCCFLKGKNVENGWNKILLFRLQSTSSAFMFPPHLALSAAQQFLLVSINHKNITYGVCSLLWQFSFRNRFNQKFIELLSSYLSSESVFQQMLNVSCVTAAGWNSIDESFVCKLFVFALKVEGCRGENMKVIKELSWGKIMIWKLSRNYDKLKLGFWWKLWRKFI